MSFKRGASFSATNPSQSEGKLAYIKLNIPTPCPPRGAVPGNQGRCWRLLHSGRPVRLRSGMRLSRLCRPTWSPCGRQSQPLLFTRGNGRNGRNARPT